MKLTAVLTEKSLAQAKGGSFTFWADKGMTKTEVAKAVERAFDVHVTSVHTLNYKGGKKRNAQGHAQQVKAAKKAIVTLKEKETIDLFEKKEK